MTTGRINQVTTFQTIWSGSTPKGRPGELQGRRTTSAGTTYTRRLRRVWLVLIRHSFEFPSGGPHSTRTTKEWKSEAPIERTESDGDMASTSDSDSQLV